MTLHLRQAKTVIPIHYNPRRKKFCNKKIQHFVVEGQYRSGIYIVEQHSGLWVSIQVKHALENLKAYLIDHDELTNLKGFLFLNEKRIVILIPSSAEVLQNLHMAY